MQEVGDLRRVHLRMFQREPQVFAAPGRVNLIGEHTDYAEGFVLPAAIDLATLAAVTPRDDNSVVLYSENFQQRVLHDLDDLPDRARGHWSDYPLGVMHVLRQAGVALPALSMSLHGDVPIGAGLSSSASIEVAAMLAVLALAGEEFPPQEVARLCQRAENGFVGVSSGIMDQFIACCGAQDHALLLDCRSLDFELVPIPHDLTLVIANTMVKHSNAGGEYNTRRAEVEAGTRLLQDKRPEIRTLRDATLEDLQKWGAEMPPNVLKRCRHIVTENARTVAAARALERGDLQELGAILAAAHASYRDDFEASCPEADLLVELARKQPECLGARLTGGGFGGCTVNLVPSARSEPFSVRLLDGYREITGIQAERYRCHASAAARRV